MSTINFGGKEYTLDDQGFLDPPEQWDEQFAEGMARTLGIRELGERHWHVIRYLRRRFSEEKVVPELVYACIDLKMRLRELRARFPTGYHRGACKIAGINYRFMYEHNYWLTYETAPPARPRYQLDPLGFLADFEQWDEDFVRLANSQLPEPPELTDRHWQLIHYLREYFREYQDIPTVFEICSENGVSMEELRALFPGGYRRGACRLAGLPFLG